MKITKEQLKQIIKEEIAEESEAPSYLVRQWEAVILEFIDSQFHGDGLGDKAAESGAIIAALENVRRIYSDNMRGDSR
jgi:hypothetical protein